MGPPIYFNAGADKTNQPTSPVDGLLTNPLDHGSTPQKIAAANTPNCSNFARRVIEVLVYHRTSSQFPFWNEMLAQGAT